MGHYLNQHNYYAPLSQSKGGDDTNTGNHHASPGITFHRRQRFRDVLRPTLVVQFIFGMSYHLCESIMYLCLSKLFLVFWFGGLCAIFAMAVFNRATMDMWVQFSLYIIPVLCLPIGAYIFSSSAYHRMLQRKITNNVSVRFFISNSFVDGEANAAAHNQEWIREIATKSVVYPLLLELIQWSGFLCFYLLGDHKEALGSVKGVPYEIWSPLYIINWFITVYIVGFVAYQFIFVSRLIVKDTVHLMSLFGNTSYLQLYPVSSFSIRNNIAFKALSAVTNFFTLDLFNSFLDERIYSDCAKVNRGYNDNSSKDRKRSTPSLFPTRALHSPFGHDGNGNEEETVGGGNETKKQCKFTPTEACEIFSVFIAEAEALTSLFIPFNITLAFFGVADLFTHVGLFVKNRKNPSISYWTMFRTLLFLLVALRMMVSVQRTSSVLSKLLPHINLIKTAGKLHCDYNTRPNWSDFTELVASYNLNRRTFGFPMSIRQIASFVTVINMAFLIIFSVLSKSPDGSVGGGNSPFTTSDGMNLTRR